MEAEKTPVFIKKRVYGAMTRLLLAPLVAAGLLLLSPAVLRADEPPPDVDFKAVENLLQKLTANQPVANLEVLPNLVPSPIPGLWEIKFKVEANGMRQTGILYISGEKVLLGNLFDLNSGENLTSLRGSPPERIKYTFSDLDMAGRIPRGNPKAKVVVVEFSDFQCPFCRKATQTLDELVEKYPNDVVLYYKHLPITQIHPLAYKMALATECARAQKDEAFWSLHDNFFSSPEFKTETQLRDHLKLWAGEEGLSGDDLLSCLESTQEGARVEKDMADARKIGARATPTFLVNGEFLQGVQDLEVFEKFIKAP
ncbi:MAG TPA: thioredoxin domain-containing protein [Nitrospiria bacterium]